MDVVSSTITCSHCGHEYTITGDGTHRCLFCGGETIVEGKWKFHQTKVTKGRTKEEREREEREGDKA